LIHTCAKKNKKNKTLFAELKTTMNTLQPVKYHLCLPPAIDRNVSFLKSNQMAIDQYVFKEQTLIRGFHNRTW